MLKVTYTESGLHLEQISQSVEQWIALRVVLALRTRHRLVLEQGRASILLSTPLVKSSALEALLQREDRETISLVPCDADFMELSLSGIWMTSGTEEAEGTFITTLCPSIEKLLCQLWQAAQLSTSPLWR